MRCGAYTDNPAPGPAWPRGTPGLSTPVHVYAARLPRGLSVRQVPDRARKKAVIHGPDPALTITTTIYVYVNNAGIRIRTVARAGV